MSQVSSRSPDRARTPDFQAKLLSYSHLFVQIGVPAAHLNSGVIALKYVRVKENRVTRYCIVLYYTRVHVSAA